MEYEESIWKRLKSNTKPVIIYGTGDGADKLINKLNELNIKISGIFASDDFARYQIFHGFTVKKYSDIKNEFGEILILVAFAVFSDEMISHINMLNSENELYAPYLPMFGTQFFDEEYISENNDLIESARNLLYDGFSKFTFDSIINFRLSGKIEYLTKIQDDTGIFNNLIPITENEIYLDLGAYNGDTALEFEKFCNRKYKKMFLVEPNRKIIPKLEINTLNLNKEIINKAAWNKTQTLGFNGKTGRSAAIDSFGKESVCCDCPDNFTKEATIIKYDVEGAEIEAIEGSKEIITNNHPTLIISAYHKTDDLFKIPFKVLKYNDYKVYLRHKKYIPDWDTLYYFIKK